MLRITSVFYLFAKRTSEKVNRNLTVPKVMLCLLIDLHFIKKKPGFRGEVLYRHKKEKNRLVWLLFVVFTGSLSMGIWIFSGICIDLEDMSSTGASQE